jgi:type VI secretion system protein ImpG
MGEASYYATHQDNIRAGIKLCLKTTGEMPFQMLTELDNLVFYLDGGGEIPNRVYELLFTQTESILIQPTSKKSRPAWTCSLAADSIQTVGFDSEQALLPYTDRSFKGYRLFQEYFNFPQRYLFFDLQHLQAAIQRCEQDELEIIFLFKEENKRLQGALSAKNFALNCTPAINLFNKRANRIHLSDRSCEHHVIPERTKPMDYEVYSINSVIGFDKNLRERQQFRPFYACEGDDSADGHQAYYSLRREPRLHTSTRQSSSDYIGTEVFISLVDASETPYSADLKQLGIELICTNRNLPQYSLSKQGKTPFTMQDDGPIDQVHSLAGPTVPKPPHPEGEAAWRLISHLSLNYLSLLDQDQQKGAAALRQLLSLYSHNTNANMKKQINGILSVKSRQIVRRIPGGGPITFGRGVEIVLTCKDSAFEGSGVFLLGSIIEQFFSQYVSLNSFTQTLLKTVERGIIKRWPIRIGTKAIL